MYELLLRNKFLTVSATSIDEIIAGLEDHVDFLKQLKATGKVQYAYGAEDDYATFVTEDASVAKMFDFHEEEFFDEEEEYDDAIAS